MTGSTEERVLSRPDTGVGHDSLPERPRRRRLLGSVDKAPPPEAGRFQDPGPLDLHLLFRRRRYVSAQLSRLSSQYVKLRGDLLVSIGDDTDFRQWPDRRPYALGCADYLRSARQELASHRPNFVLCSSLLILADITLVWLYPSGRLGLRADEVLEQLQNHQPRARWLERGIRDTRDVGDDRFLRNALENALNYLHRPAQDGLIEDDLQVTRLRVLVGYISLAFLMLLAAVPYVTTRLAGGIEGWPVFEFDKRWLTETVAAAAVSALGAVGGIFSGLISTRDSKATLVEYRTSMLKLALKPLVGAVAALTLYLLLSWQILTGVQVTNGGTFLLVGFLAGFSERYFLRLLTSASEGRGSTTGTRIRDEAAAEASIAVGPPPSIGEPAAFSRQPIAEGEPARQATQADRSLGEP